MFILDFLLEIYLRIRLSLHKYIFRPIYRYIYRIFYFLFIPPPKPIEPNVLKGELFETIKEFKGCLLTNWKAAFTGGYEITIPTGTKIQILHDSGLTAKGFSCLPVNYKEFEVQHVKQIERLDPKYNGYYLVLMKHHIGDSLVKLHNKPFNNALRAGTSASQPPH